MFRIFVLTLQLVLLDNSDFQILNNYISPWLKQSTYL